MIERHVAFRALVPAKVLRHIVPHELLPLLRRVIVKRQRPVDGRKEIVRVIALERKAASLALGPFIGRNRILSPPVAFTTGTAPKRIAISCESPQGSDFDGIR